MSTEVVNIEERRKSFQVGGRQGELPLTTEERKKAKDAADPKQYRKVVSEPSHMRKLIDKVINLMRIEDLSMKEAVCGAVLLLAMQESDEGERLNQVFQDTLESMNIPLADMKDLHIHLDLENSEFRAAQPWTQLNCPGVLNIFAHIAGLQSRTAEAACFLNSNESELSPMDDFAKWCTRLYSMYRQSGMQDVVNQVEGLRARLMRSSHALSAKALTMIGIWEAAYRNGAPEDLTAFLMHQLRNDLVAWRAPEPQQHRSLAALSGGGHEHCAYCRQRGHGYRRCEVRKANKQSGKPHPPHWKEHYHTESAH